MKPKILFTGYYFDSYSGSQMHICEIAEYLTQKGYSVDIAAVHITKEIENFTKEMGANLYYADQIPLDNIYDIVWTYHANILPFLLSNGLKYKKLISGCLSGFLIPLETPQYLSLYNKIPLYVNSEETKKNIIQAYPFVRDNTKILLNMVPDKYLNYTKTLPDKVKQIVIVSNHIPQEISNSIPLFNNAGIKVDIYGETQNKRITPEILIKYDVIITIGKTVQYGLTLGIPVYNYDHFGGPGYITLANYLDAEFYNYSGRNNQRKLSPNEIYQEIISLYQNTCQDIKQLQTYARNKYPVSINIDRVILDIENMNDNIIPFDPSDLYIKQTSWMTARLIEQYRHIQNYQNIIDNQNRHIQNCQNIIDNQNSQIQTLNTQVVELNAQNYDLKLLLNDFTIKKKYLRYLISYKVLIGKKRKHYKNKFQKIKKYFDELKDLHSNKKNLYKIQ